jgi:type IV secretion system protein VirB6
MKKLLQLVILIFCTIHSSYAEDNGTEEWMNSSISGMSNYVPGCINPPDLINVKESTTSLNLSKSGKWIATRAYVQENKLLQINWDLKNIQTVPEKYLVLYRIDPRFKIPQVFIQKYDYAQDKYISDFHQFQSGQLLKFQLIPEMTFDSRVKAYIDFFNFTGRSRIPVKKNDVINISLDEVGNYFSPKSEMIAELSRLPSAPSVIYTGSSGMDNKIIYADITSWCELAKQVKSTDDYVCSPNKGSPPAWCTNSSNCSDGKYKSPIDFWGGLVGSPVDGAFEAAKASIKPCPNGANSNNNTTVCAYDKGRGMQIRVGNKIVKPNSDSFVTSPYTKKDFFYYKSDTDGDLTFTTEWPIQGMFSGSVEQFMDSISWRGFADYKEFSTYLAEGNESSVMNFMHFGRYAMEIEIGTSESSITSNDLQNIKVEYIIMEDGMPNETISGTEISMDNKTNANASGYLWLRVINNSTDNVGGAIQVKTSNYSGSTWFSDIIYGKLISPLRIKFNELTKMLYSKLASDPLLQNIARGMLTLYISIYALGYLAGSTQITVTDLVTRVLKIGVVLALFSKTSWNFFNDNVFVIFIQGTDYLFTNVVGATSQVGNIFGFIDPILDKYTNGTVWGLLFIQLLMIHNGLCFFAIMTIYSIIVFFRAVIEVIISYCLAFVGLAVMVSLAPFFITFLLFEQTKSMFTNWISTMFSYMIQPTVLLVFFLLIDQMMSEHILHTIVPACWGILIPFEFGLDLNFMNIPLSFSFTLPFLPGIPFYVSHIQEVTKIEDLVNGHGTFIILVTSSLLFFSYCKMSGGLVDYITIIVENLTNVVAARQDGKLQNKDQSKNPIHDVTSDMKKASSPVTNRVKSVGRFTKEKGVDQKITHRQKSVSHGGVNSGGAGGSSSSGNTGGTPPLPRGNNTGFAANKGAAAPQLPPRTAANYPPLPPGNNTGSAANKGAAAPQLPPRTAANYPPLPPRNNTGSAGNKPPSALNNKGNKGNLNNE